MSISIKYWYWTNLAILFISFSMMYYNLMLISLGHSRFWLSYMRLWVYLLPKTIRLFSFPIF